jgi:pimeloyl-ACP methyl ester carboxylesterase
MLTVLIPGLMNDAWVWAQQIGALSRLGPVHVACNDGLDDLRAMAGRVLETSAGPLNVIGHSMGGRVALELLNLAPERVAKLALLDTGVHGPRETEAAGRDRLVEIARGQGMAAVARAWAPDMLAPANRQNAAITAGIAAMLQRCRPEDFAAQQRALLGRQDRTALLSRIACPTLVATGAHDAWSSPEQHAQMARAITGARLAVIEAAGHMTPVEAPDAVTALLTDLLAAE